LVFIGQASSLDMGNVVNICTRITEEIKKCVFFSAKGGCAMNSEVQNHELLDFGK